MKYHCRNGSISFSLSSGELLHHMLVFKYGMKGYGPSASCFPGRKEVHLKLATELSLLLVKCCCSYIFSAIHEVYCIYN